jgi:tetratricopeptide (TPR) repeat protein/DNA-binding CsgD family transcriptional regulator
MSGSQLKIYLTFLFSIVLSALYGQPRGQNHVADSLIALSERTDLPDTARTRLYLQIGIALKESDMDLAWKYLKAGSAKARAASDPSLISQFIMLELTLTGLKGNPVELQELARKYESELLGYGYPIPISCMYNELARVAYKSGDYSKAGELFSKVAETGRKHKLHRVELVALINLGAMFETQGRFAEMRDQMQLVQNLAKEYNCPDELNLATINLGYSEYSLKNYGTAMDYFRSVIPALEKSDNKLRLAYCFGCMANCLKDLGKFEEAKSYAHKCISMREKMSDETGLARALIFLGEIQMKLSMTDSAAISLRMAIDRSRKLNARFNLVEAYKLLSELYAQNGDFLNAYQASLQYSSWKDSVYQIEKDEKLDKQFNLMKATQTDSLTRAVKQQIRSGKSEVLYLRLSLLALLALSLGAWWFLKRNKPASKRDFNDIAAGTATKYHDFIQSLESKNRSLQADISAMEMAIRAIEQDRRNSVSGSMESLREIARRTKINESGWDEFMLLFSKLHPLFFAQLKQSYPVLTSNELRFCAFLKIGLTHAEMANALNISTDSIRKARYRLYRRMEFESEQEMINYIDKYI